MRNTGTPLTRGITFKDKIGYALGDVGCQLSFALIGPYLQLFYTKSLHIDLGQITVLMFIARIWDGINDPICGTVIDRLKPGKHGKFRPYLIWFGVPIAIISVLMFLKIPGLSSNQYLIYAYITYIAYDMAFTCVNIPYGSLASVITDDPNERADLSLFRSLGSGLGGLPAQILLPLFIFSTTLDGEEYLDTNKLSTAVMILAALSIVIYYLSFKMTKERIISPPKAKQDSNIIETIKVLFKNRPFLVLCVISMLLIAVTLYTQTIYTYLYVDYFKSGKLVSLVTICTYAPMLLLTPVLGKLVRRFGNKRLCAAGVLLSAFANFAIWIIRTENPYFFLVFCFLSGLGATFLTMEIWAMATDVIDYQEYLSSKREEGTSYAFFSFTRKLGHTIAGSGGAMVLGLIGYNEKTLIQTEEVLHNMYSISTLIPAMFYLLAFVCLAFLYPLGKKEVIDIQQKLTEKRSIQIGVNE